MANPVCEVLLTDAELKQPGFARDASAGGIVDFWGVVRALENGREIAGLAYETHRPMAEHQLRVIGEEAAKKFGLQHLSIQHRVGFVPAGEASLLVRTAAAHRTEAFAAGQWVVDELKKRVPIWKRAKFIDAEPGTKLMPELKTTSRQ